MSSMRWLCVAAALAITGAVRAGEAAHAHDHAALSSTRQTAWGVAGDAAKVQQTVEVRMLDTMRFVPDKIEIARGKTVRFVLVNAGKLAHEFVLGTKKELEHHAAEMAKMRDMPMHHAEPSMAEVAPGQRDDVIWTFNRAGTFVFACLVPGHYEAGMYGTIIVR